MPSPRTPASASGPSPSPTATNEPPDPKPLPSPVSEPTLFRFFSQTLIPPHPPPTCMLCPVTQEFLSITRGRFSQRLITMVTQPSPSPPLPTSGPSLPTFVSLPRGGCPPNLRSNGIGPSLQAEYVAQFLKSNTTVQVRGEGGRTQEEGCVEQEDYTGGGYSDCSTHTTEHIVAQPHKFHKT